MLGGMLLGHRPVCAVEISPDRRRILLSRQRDGIFPSFPVWDDVRTFDARPWQGVGVVAGGFPCQGASVAGRGRGLDDTRTGLWSEMRRVVDECRPRYVFGENSPALLRRGWGRIVGDLAAMGYGVRWGCLSARDLGAPHVRERLFFLADADAIKRAKRIRLEQVRAPALFPKDDGDCLDAYRRSWVEGASNGHRVGNGVTSRVVRAEALGDAQVPAVAASAFSVLMAAR